MLPQNEFIIKNNDYYIKQTYTEENDTKIQIYNIPSCFLPLK